MSILRKVILGMIICISSVVSTTAQTGKKVSDVPGGAAQLNHNPNAPRPLEYQPEGQGFVSVNGHNRYTRALYGSPTLFRIETSDRPVFATYNKTVNKHISFKLVVNGKSLALDSTTYCKSIYSDFF